MRVRVTTKTCLFEERKRQHVERGYRIEDGQPTPVNGLRSFVAVWEPVPTSEFAELMAQGEPMNGSRTLNQHVRPQIQGSAVGERYAPEMMKVVNG